MDGLIERLQSAKGHDRDLNCDIFVAVHPRHRKKQCLGFESLISYVVGRDGEIEVPRYTDSLDAAAALVPACWSWNVAAPEPRNWGQAVVGRSYPTNATIHQEAHTPAIALCIAALKARMHDAQSESGSKNP